MKELKTIRDILQALLDGHEIEEKFEPQNTWETVVNTCFDTRYLDDAEVVAAQGKYRIKPTKPSIDWSHVHPEYNCLARDEDGLVYLYENKPKLNKSTWWSVGGGDFISASTFKSLDVGTCDWKDSLVERPKDNRL